MSLLVVDVQMQIVNCVNTLPCGPGHTTKLHLFDCFYIKKQQQVNLLFHVLNHSGGVLLTHTVIYLSTILLWLLLELYMYILREEEILFHNKTGIIFVAFCLF